MAGYALMKYGTIDLLGKVCVQCGGKFAAGSDRDRDRVTCSSGHAYARYAVLKAGPKYGRQRVGRKEAA